MCSSHVLCVSELLVLLTDIEETDGMANHRYETLQSAAHCQIDDICSGCEALLQRGEKSFNSHLFA